MELRATGALEAHDLYRFYHAGNDETLALRGVSLRVMAGEMVAIVGPSGSGKSTLLACLSGMDDPDGGTVFVGGERLSRLDEKDRTALRTRWIGMLFQSGNLLEHLTIRDNLVVAQHSEKGPTVVPTVVSYRRETRFARLLIPKEVSVAHSITR